jgi:hypothetical protein
VVTSRSGRLRTVKQGGRDWWRWRHDELPLTVDLRADVVAGRWTIVEMRIVGAKTGVQATHLREVPLGELEADIAATMSSTYPRTYPRRYGLVDPFDFALPERVPYPAEFFSAIADAYRWLSARGMAPGPALSEHFEVPLSTAHGWIKQARRRGLLPPGRKGKTG